VARIKLIVTGDMEKLALHKSLQKCFPSRRDGVEVVWEVPHKMSGATSHKLDANEDPSKPMRALAKALIAEACIGKYGSPSDLVIVVDDVELGNIGQEHVIASHFREAVQKELDSHKGNITLYNEYKEQLQTRCSYHVLKPMVESYLFGDPAALTLAGVPDGKLPQLVHISDVEEFETNDVGWLPTCVIENAKKVALGIPWWRHEFHPKHYLEHLSASDEFGYDETEYGKRALIALDWTQVPENVNDFPIIRSLFEDLSLWFGVANPVGAGLLHPSFYPGATVRRSSLLLRNM